MSVKREVMCYPEDKWLHGGVEFQMQVTVQDRMSDLEWVRLERGRQGKIIGRIMGDGGDAGKVVLFEDHVQEYLVPNLIALVVIKESKPKFSFAMFEPMNLGVWGDTFVVEVMPRSYPIYNAKTIEEAEEQHLLHMKKLIHRGAGAYLEATAVHGGITVSAQGQPDPTEEHAFVKGS